MAITFVKSPGWSIPSPTKTLFSFLFIPITYSGFFLPPTLIASIYGLNFTYIPGLSFKHGYIIAASLMVLSAYIPYKYFKKHGWF